MYMEIYQMILSESFHSNTFLLHHFSDLYFLSLDSVKWCIIISLWTGRLFGEWLNFYFAMTNVYSTIALQSDISIYFHKLRFMKMQKTLNFHIHVWPSLMPAIFNGQHRLASSLQVFSDRTQLSCLSLMTYFLCVSLMSPHSSAFFVNSATNLPVFHTENTSGVNKFLSRKLFPLWVPWCIPIIPTHHLGVESQTKASLRYKASLKTFLAAWALSQFPLECKFINMCISTFTYCSYLNLTTSKFATEQQQQQKWLFFFFHSFRRQVRQNTQCPDSAIWGLFRKELGPFTLLYSLHICKMAICAFSSDTSLIHINFGF